LVLIKGNKWTFRRPLNKVSITTYDSPQTDDHILACCKKKSAKLWKPEKRERGCGAAEKIISYIKLTQHYRIALTESQCYYKTIADLINGNETER
jgi:hypothetical protein